MSVRSRRGADTQDKSLAAGDQKQVKAYFDGYARTPDTDADSRGVAKYGMKRLRRKSD